jgi:hypothetical protein
MSPDGERWVSDQISSNGASAEIRDQSAQRLIVLGYITAVAMPPIGFILGIVVATRPSKQHSKHARWILAISIVAAIVWILIFSSGVINTTDSDFS